MTRRAEIRRVTTYFVYTNLLVVTHDDYMRVCPLVRRSVGWSVGPSVGPSETQIFGRPKKGKICKNEISDDEAGSD